MAKADDDKKKAEQAKLEAGQAEPAEKANGLVLVRFDKTCAGPKGTFSAGSVVELDVAFVEALEKDNAVSRIK